MEANLESIQGEYQVQSTEKNYLCRYTNLNNWNEYHS